LLNAGLVELVKPADSSPKGAAMAKVGAKQPSTPQKPVITKLIDRIKNL
jgi:hypothetical protein